MYTMPCPVCFTEPGSGNDHRWCLAELFRSNRIKSIADWHDLCKPPKPKTVVKGNTTIQVKKEDAK